jgi:hypothetical protein
MVLFICSYIEVKSTLGFFPTAKIDKESLTTTAIMARKRGEHGKKHMTMTGFVFYFNLNS